MDRVEVETFKLPVPVDRGGRIEVGDSGQEFPIYGLWPNHVRYTLAAGPRTPIVVV